MGNIRFLHSPMLSVLRGPVQAVAAWFVTAQKASGQPAMPVGVQRATSQLELPFASNNTVVRRRHALVNTTATKFSKTALEVPARSRLRVVRQFDSAVSPACAGRMVISGRMTDVCAELDRLVQRGSGVN